MNRCFNKSFADGRCTQISFITLIIIVVFIFASIKYASTAEYKRYGKSKKTTNRVFIFENYHEIFRFSDWKFFFTIKWQQKKDNDKITQKIRQQISNSKLTDTNESDKYGEVNCSTIFIWPTYMYGLGENKSNSKNEIPIGLSYSLSSHENH